MTKMAWLLDKTKIKDNPEYIRSEGSDSKLSQTQYVFIFLLFVL